jgi:hypothetical protein
MAAEFLTKPVDFDIALALCHGAETTPHRLTDRLLVGVSDLVGGRESERCGAAIAADPSVRGAPTATSQAEVDGRQGADER